MANRSDLEKELNLTRRQMDTLWGNFTSSYNLKMSWFKGNMEEEGKYDFPPDVFDLLKVMLQAYDFYLHSKSAEKGILTTTELTTFYKEIIRGMDDSLSVSLRLEIQSNPIYLRTISEVEGLTQLSKKFAHFLAASNEISDDMRTSLWTKLYKAMDDLIYECFDLNMMLQEEYENQLEAIENKYKEYIQSVESSLVPNFDGQSTVQKMESIKEEEMIEVHNLQKQYDQRRTVRTLDGLIVSMIKDQLFKRYYQENIQPMEGIQLKRKKERPNEKFFLAAKKETHIEGLEQKAENDMQHHNEQIKRVTGYDIEELRELKLKQLTAKSEEHIENVRHQFSSIVTTEKRVNELLQSSLEIAVSPPIGLLNRRNIGGELQSIKQQLFHLHEKIDGVLYEPLEVGEKEDYLRVMEVVEQALAGIELLKEPSIVRNGQMREYYQHYLDFFHKTEGESHLFDAQAEAFVIKPSVEALNDKYRDRP